MMTSSRSVAFFLRGKMLLILIMLLFSASVFSTSLVITTQPPATVVAGEEFVLQPVIKLVDTNGDVLSDTNTGTVTASLYTNPKGNGILSPASNSFTFNRGVATFTGLSLDVAATGYQILFTSTTYSLQVISAEFNVTIGSSRNVALVTHPGGSLTGGSTFQTQPVVAIVDLGGNVVNSIHTGTATVAITTTPTIGASLSGTTTLKFSYGLATFTDLSINKAGVSYILSFTASNVDNVSGTNAVVDSVPLTISSGPPAALKFVTQPSTTSSAGMAFSIQPVLELVDAGENRVTNDSVSVVNVAIAKNPSSLNSIADSSVTLVSGLGTFTNLKINTAGVGYSLNFTLHSPKSSLLNETAPLLTDISIESNDFTISVGPTTTYIGISQEPAGAAADGQPFLTPVKTELQDSGGNVITSENSAVITATMASSLSTTSNIIVDTESAPVTTTVVTVTSDLAFVVGTSPYGAGTVIDILVTFSQQVVVTGSPTLLLETGGVDAEAACISVNEPLSNVVKFRYTVADGESSADLQYVSASTSLALNADGAILDARNAAVSLELPAIGDPASLSGSSAIEIDTTVPTIVSVSSVDGEYGVGQELDITVTFSAPVTVQGVPTIQVVLDGTDATAPYVSGSGTTDLIFRYIVVSGDTSSASIDVTANVAMVDSSTIIRTSTSSSVTLADLSIPGAPNNLATTSSVVIDTSTVTIDPLVGITTSKVDGTYGPGEEIDLLIQFTKPVTVTGIPLLFLDAGTQWAEYVSGSDTNILTFRYVVGIGYSHSSGGADYLDYRDNSALELNSGTIMRYVSQGTATAAADLSLTSTTVASKSLADNHSIKVSGGDLTVLTVAFATVDGTYSRTNDVDITISFSSSVVVDITDGTPSVLLGPGVDREALYVSGSSTSALLFRYNVQLGDSSAALDYASTSALSLNGGTIKQSSSNPTLDAILTLPALGSITGNIVIDNAAGFTTVVSSINANVLAAEYGENHLIEIDVTFSDIVTLVSGVPALSLDTGNDASYDSGSGTNVLKFLYIVQNGDTTASLNKASNAALVCSGSCSITNLNSASVSLDLSSVDLSPTSIVLSTVAPTVVSVSSSTPASTKNSNSFVVGDTIDISITMSHEVFVNPAPEVESDNGPLLTLETGDTDRSVPFIEYGTDNTDRTVLIFRYVVQEGDSTEDLTYVDTNSLTLNCDEASIKRFSTNPTTDAVLTLPAVIVPLGTGAGNTLKVDTSIVPVVTGVDSSTIAGTYYVGDVISIQLTFSSSVVVTGAPLLWLEVGDTDRTAVYVSGSESAVLSFDYTVTAGDVSTDLAYVDTNSIEIPAGASILQHSAAPSIPATLTLPSPGATGSLDDAEALVIDGKKAHVTGITSTTVDGTYTLGQTIDIVVEFSKSVSVTGIPTILLETGNQDRYALYVSGSPGTQLTFQYTIENGDASTDLDYKETTSIILNDGVSILTTSGTPTDPADLHLNPPKGQLFGTLTQTSTLGEATFADLHIGIVGTDYRVYFSVGGSIYTYTSFKVWYSSEYEVRSSSTVKGSKLGWSVDISGDTVIMGAIGEKKARNEVQTITTTGTAPALVNAIQSIKTSAVHLQEVQKIVTTASVGETLGGYFTITYGAGVGIPTTRRIRFDASESQMRIELELDLGLQTNSLEVTRSPNTFCSCTNAYEWTITFLTLQGDIPLLTASSFLTGGGASVGDGEGGSTAVSVTASPVLSGTFLLKYNGLSTSALDYDVDPDTLKTRLITDLSLPVSIVTRNGPDLQLGYNWTVVITTSTSAYDIADLEPVYSDTLVGNEATVVVQTIQEGQAPISGNFRLKFKESTWAEETVDIPIDASATEVRDALKGLTAITDVAVTRDTDPNAYGGYTWQVTFLEVNTLTDFGIVQDTLGNLVPMTAVLIDSSNDGLSLITGTGATVVIDHFQQYHVDGDALEFGSVGNDAGAAYVFTKINSQWNAQSPGKLVPSDLEGGDKFGYSVATDGDRSIIGAPYATEKGVKEVQILSCTADGGTFTLSFKDTFSSPIAFDAVASTLQSAVAGLLNVESSKVTIAAYTDLCDGSNIIMTLNAPDQADASGDISELGTGGAVTLSVTESVKGKYRLDGSGATAKKAGAAYFFHRSASVWSENAKVYTEGGDSGDEFGYSVDISGDYAVIGAPGASTSKGSAVVFKWDGAKWDLHQTISSSPYVSAVGDRFGHSVSISSTTLVVGAPGYDSKKGAAFVFYFDGGSFVNSQMIHESNDLMAGDEFGGTVSVDTGASTIACTAENHDSLGTDTGAVYIYSVVNSVYELQQKLTDGVLAKPHSRFGHSVSLDTDTIVVSALEDYTGTLSISKAVQSVSTTAESAIGNGFYLGFRQTLDGADDEWKDRYSRLISHDCTATTLKNIMEEDLGTGDLLVNREGPDAFGGYTWSITFAGSTGQIPQLIADGSPLTGIRPSIDVSLDVPVPPMLQSNVHVFTRTSEVWTEQATLKPRRHQYFSMYGASVAMDDRTAIIGAYNRDTIVPGTNGGAGSAFDLSFLNFAFSSSSYTVSEGSDATIAVTRCGSDGLSCHFGSSDEVLYVNYDTGDALSHREGSSSVAVNRLIGPEAELAMRDAPPYSTGTTYYPNVRGPEPYPLVPNGRWIPSSYIGTAVSRAQFYGSTEKRSSHWVNGLYDLDGLADYVPASSELSYNVGSISQSFSVSTTSDYVVEDPDETLNLRLSVIGMWPSFTGQLWSTLTIVDDGDGGIGTQDYATILYAADPSTAAEGFGKAVDIDEAHNIAIVGAPDAVVNGLSSSGAAYVYVRTSGIWEIEATLLPDSGAASRSRFGASAKIDGAHGTVRALVGAPGSSPAAYVFVRNPTTTEWSQEAILVDPTSSSAARGRLFADSRTIGLYGDVAIVGAPVIEALFVYERLEGGWSAGETLRSPDYDADLLGIEQVVHVAHFGASADINERTIVVGSPLANYGNIGTPGVVDIDVKTSSVDNSFFGTGAAYTFFKQAQIQEIILLADQPLTTGTFALSLTHRGVTTTSDGLSYDSTAANVVSALEALSNIDHVRVSVVDTIETASHGWKVTFYSEFSTVPLLVPTWSGDGCGTCEAFSDDYSVNPTAQVTVTETQAVGTLWESHGSLYAPGANLADRVGYDVAISSNQVILGAYAAASSVSTVWDFETGNLNGWETTGTAFDTQPTFGDNSYARVVYGDESYDDGTSSSLFSGQTAWHEGRYWIGTFENRPGAGHSNSALTKHECVFDVNDCKAADYKLPGQTSYAGSTQGDEPVGTMTSRPFTILGSTISFRVGGGCNINEQYVELLLDGRAQSDYKVTGRCRETMNRHSWEVSSHFNKTAQLRVVDASSGSWGHINFDDVRFDWDIKQTTSTTSSSYSGVAYTFRRKKIGSTIETCSSSLDPQTECDWEFQSRLQPTDSRGGDKFGVYVTINDALGIALIGATKHHLVDSNNTAVKPETSVGAVYVFKRRGAVLNGEGSVVTAPTWPANEWVKLQGLHPSLNDAAGTSVSLGTDSAAIVGVPGSNSAQILDMSFHHFRFEQPLYVVMENDSQSFVEVTIVRNETTVNTVMTIGYSTSDETLAIGKDDASFTACLEVALADRGSSDCGDYRQSDGELTFSIGEISKRLLIPIMNDNCYEHDVETFQVALHIPGGVRIIGPQYVAHVRIDDDDTTECSSTT